ncbi:MAG: MFS transporter [Gammaproteobacteria bacterium]|nr:MFS transporter [Gammaproteobacteria bacterium]
MIDKTGRDWQEALAVYSKPRVIAMSFLGFSAGLPFLLVFSTLSAWLRDSGLALSTIGFFSWIGITYSIKVFWAPVVDRTPIFLLTGRLGKRRSWMLSAQLLIALGLAGMAMSDPQAHLQQIAIFALLVAFGSATQDITIDAYRIEAVDRLLQGAMAASYVFGYRVALLVAGAGAFYIAAAQSWQYAYFTMACLMGIGVVTTLIIAEPAHPVSDAAGELESEVGRKMGVKEGAHKSDRLAAWFASAVVSPFVEFFRRNGLLALVILLLIGTFRLSDITVGVMANPFYLDLGFSKIEIANITKIFGFFMTILGAGLGGIFVLRYGIYKPLLLGAILVPVTNLFFVWLAMSDPDTVSLAVVISMDNLSGGFATSAFIAYLSSLTNTTYTATQYALFSSLMTLPAKIIGGFSGIVVEAAGYAWFFLYAGVLGAPALLLIIYLMRKPVIPAPVIPAKAGIQ